MMRSLFSGVAGLKTHQTKMDVIGNNIANVNTAAYKAQNVTFQDLIYQTARRASGANPAGGVGGINASQVGLGVKVAAINTNITLSGALQTTNLPFDIAITGDSFFVVSNGQENFFTRAGSFYIDGVGNLAMTSTGFNVMGWGVDPENPNNIRKDTVQALRVMGEGLMEYPAEATTKATISGIVDKNDTDLNSSTGKIMTLDFYDELGFRYTAKLSAHPVDPNSGDFYIKLDDIVDVNGVSMKDKDPIKFAAVTFGGPQVVQSNNAYLRQASTVLTQTITLDDGSGNDYEQLITSPATTYKVGDPATFGSTVALDDTEIASLYGADAGTAAAKNGATYTMAKNGTITITYTEAGVTTVKGYAIGGTAATQNATAEITGIRLSNGAATPAAMILTTMPASFTIDPVTGNISPLPTMDPALGAPPAAADQAVFRTYLETVYGAIPAGAIDFNINADGTMTVTRKRVENAALVNYNPANGAFTNIGGNTDGLINLVFDRTAPGMEGFRNIELDFSTTLMNNNNKKSTLSATAGGTGENKGIGAGRRLGEMVDVVVQDDGRIYANYSNGMSRLLGQIATATFANASGLEKRGDNLYKDTMNSGSFDGIGEDIKANGGYMTTGMLEMSNVDLSSEFTEMITTQRGFQANSRIITVSDSLLEELTNLKR